MIDNRLKVVEIWRKGVFLGSIPSYFLEGLDSLDSAFIAMMAEVSLDSLRQTADTFRDRYKAQNGQHDNDGGTWKL